MYVARGAALPARPGDSRGTRWYAAGAESTSCGQRDVRKTQGLLPALRPHFLPPVGSSRNALRAAEADRVFCTPEGLRRRRQLFVARGVALPARSWDLPAALPAARGGLPIARIATSFPAHPWVPPGTRCAQPRPTALSARPGGPRRRRQLYVARGVRASCTPVGSSRNALVRSRGRPRFLHGHGLRRRSHPWHNANCASCAPAGPSFRGARALPFCGASANNAAPPCAASGAAPQKTASDGALRRRTPSLPEAERGRPPLPHVPSIARGVNLPANASRARPPWLHSRQTRLRSVPAPAAE